jgi:hypothetical protein
VRIKQLAYFGIFSETVSADDVGRRIGLESERTSVRGSRIADPPRPKFHIWRAQCDTPGLTVDEQIARVMARLDPYRAAIGRAIAEIEDAHASLSVVRYFGAWLAEDEGEEEELTVTPDGLEKLPGQHQLLGWHLSREVMEFLLDVGAEMDFDEYG